MVSILDSRNINVNRIQSLSSITLPAIGTTDTHRDQYNICGICMTIEICERCYGCTENSDMQGQEKLPGGAVTSVVEHKL